MPLTADTLVKDEAANSKANSTLSSSSCFHCGDPCEDLSVVSNEKNFCCHGCKTVYELLTEHGMENYYSLNQSPGAKRRQAAVYEYLDNEKVSEKLLIFDTAKVSKVELELPSIHCSSCIWLLENLSKIHAGVIHCRVHFIKKKAIISFNKQIISLRELVTLLDEIGYTPAISLEGENKTKKTKNPLVLQLAVAGFFFGNSMFISLPTYLDWQADLSEEILRFFSYLNVLFTLPVIFFSAKSYFSSAIKGIRKKQVNIDVPIALGIVVLFGQTIFEVLSGVGVGYADSLIGLVFFLLLGKWYQNKTYQALSFERTYKSFFPIAVQRVVDGDREFIPIEQLRAGDVIQVSNGEVIPADGQLLKGKGFIDYSFVSGESLEENVMVGDKLFAGGKQNGAPIQILITNKVSTSYLTDLWNQFDNKNEQSPGLQNIVNQISAHFTKWLLILVATASACWFFIDAGKMLAVASSIMIVACPCALALALPFAYGHALRHFGRQKFYLKGAHLVEQLAHIKQVVFDKTGTLTENDPISIHFVGDHLSADEESLINTVCSGSMHPYSRLIVSHLTRKSVDRSEIELESYQEVEGSGICATIAGCQVKVGSWKFLNQPKGLSEAACVHVSINGVYKGYYEVSNSYRPGILNMLSRLKEKFVLHLLSGDNDQERKRLSPFFKKLLFNKLPTDKLDYLRHLDKQDNTMMLGDGLNDAGALKLANVGVAVTSGTHQFSPACDAILDGEQLSQVDQFLDFAQYVYRVVKWAFFISIGYNLVGLSFAVTAHLTPVLSAILMPLSSVTVVGFITLLINQKAKKLFTSLNNS